MCKKKGDWDDVGDDIKTIGDLQKDDNDDSGNDDDDDSGYDDDDDDDVSGNDDDDDDDDSDSDDDDAGVFQSSAVAGSLTVSTHSQWRF